jgi:excisionase family DNA binding protein
MEATTNAAPLLFDRPQAAKRLAISLRTLDAMLAEGQIRPTRLRGSVRISAAELERIARDGTNGPAR